MLSSFQSRVARRVFVLFFLSTVLPVVITLVLIASLMSSELQARHLDGLQQTAKSFGLAVFERLQFVARGTEAWLAQGAPRSALPPGVLAVEIGPAEELESPVTAPFRRLAVDRSSGEPELLLYQWAEDGQLVISTLDWRFLWGPDGSIPHDVGLCLLDGTQAPLFCPAVETGRVARLLEAEMVQSAVWQGVMEQSEPVLASYWTLFLEAEFRALGWTVVTSQPRQIALAALGSFETWFLPTVGLAVVITIWLTLVQVRRRLRPLDRLRDATAKIADGDFSSVLTLDTRDEFEELADAFNEMTSQLGRQFAALSTLGEVDRLILSNAATDDVVEQSLEFLVGSLGCEQVLVTVFEETPEEAVAYLRRKGGGNTRQRLTLDPDRIRTQVKGRHSWCDMESLLPPGAPGLVARCPERMLVFPLLISGACNGFMAVQGTGIDEGDGYWLRMIEEFCDRVSVAVASIRREAALYRQAHYDQLTGLPNRQLFKDRLDRAIENACREDSSGALLFVDLDHFKAVNDSEGHIVGDQLLVMAGRRLRDSLRRVDTVARLGGDEFTILLSRIDGLEEASHVADAVVALLARPFVIDGVEHFVGASIGIAVFPSDGENADQLLQSADTAMYQAKDKGRGVAVFFNEAMNRRVRDRRELETDLRHALVRQELELYFQPKVDMFTEVVVGAEALLRWHHPRRGLLTPDRFIAVAEDTGLIAEIGEWVLATAATSWHRWCQRGLRIGSLAVNVSVRQFREPGFVDHVIEAVQRHALPPGLLELELTESLFMEESEGLRNDLRRLQDHGVRLAIDDFGTGYSSLSYLERVPFDTLKVDKSFLRELPGNPRARAITRAVITLGISLEKTVVAEGVETASQAEFLRQEACVVAQGFLYGRPMPYADFFDRAMADTTGKARQVRSERIAGAG